MSSKKADFIKKWTEEQLKDKTSNPRSTTWAFEALSVIIKAKSMNQAQARKNKRVVSNQYKYSKPNNYVQGNKPVVNRKQSLPILPIKTQYQYLRRSSISIVYQFNHNMFKNFFHVLNDSKNLIKKTVFNKTASTNIIQDFLNRYFCYFSTYMCSTLDIEHQFILQSKFIKQSSNLNNLYLLEKLSNLSGNKSINESFFLSRVTSRKLFSLYTFSGFFFSNHRYFNVKKVKRLSTSLKKTNVCFFLYNGKLVFDKDFYLLQGSSNSSTQLRNFSSYHRHKSNWLVQLLTGNIKLKTSTNHVPWLSNFILMKTICSSFKFLNIFTKYKAWDTNKALMYSLYMLVDHIVLGITNRFSSKNVVSSLTFYDLLISYFSVNELSIKKLSSKHLDAITPSIDSNSPFEIHNTTVQSLSSRFKLQDSSYLANLVISLNKYKKVSEKELFYLSKEFPKEFSKIKFIQKEISNLKRIFTKYTSNTKKSFSSTLRKKKWFLKFKQFNYFLKSLRRNLISSRSKLNLTNSTAINSKIASLNTFQYASNVLDRYTYKLRNYRSQRTPKKYKVSQRKFFLGWIGYTNNLDVFTSNYLASQLFYRKVKKRYFRKRYKKWILSKNKKILIIKNADYMSMKHTVDNFFKTKNLLREKISRSFFISIFLEQNKLITTFRNYLIKNGLKEKATKWTLEILTKLKLSFKISPTKLLSFLLMGHYHTSLFKEREINKKKNLSVIIPKRLSSKKQLFYMVDHFFKEATLFSKPINKNKPFLENRSHSRIVRYLLNYIFYLTADVNKNVFLVKKNRVLEERMSHINHYTWVKKKKKWFFKKKYSSYKGHR